MSGSQGDDSDECCVARSLPTALGGRDDLEYVLDKKMTAQSYDIIGDIHGQADALIGLLKKMGYEERSGSWRHSERQVIFVRTAALLSDGLCRQLPEIPIPSHSRVNPPIDKPILFGHYWLTGQPKLQAERVVCLD